MISACFYKYIINVIVASQRHQSWNLAMTEHINYAQCIMGLCELILQVFKYLLLKSDVSLSCSCNVTVC